MRFAAILGRERTVAANFTAADGPFWHVFGGCPVGLIGHAGQRKTVGCRTGSQAQHAVVLFEVFRLLPRAIVANEFERAE
jgi:hypothetical protein